MLACANFVIALAWVYDIILLIPLLFLPIELILSPIHHTNPMGTAARRKTSNDIVVLK